MSVEAVLEARYQDLENYLRVHYKLERQEVLDDIFVKSVKKILRRAPVYNPARSSEWTWMVMVARGVANQVLDRLDARDGLNPRGPVDLYMRGQRELVNIHSLLLRTYENPESILSASQIVDPSEESL